MSVRLHRFPRQDRFDRFTERARQVLSLAQEEAQQFQHNYIGTEHLLVGLIREGEGVAARVLKNMGVDLADARRSVEKIINRGNRAVLGGGIGLTPRAKKVMELAINEACRLNHHYIGTEHLLLGLLAEGEGIAAGVLESLGINLQEARREVQAELERITARNTANKIPPFAIMALVAAASALLAIIAFRRRTS